MEKRIGVIALIIENKESIQKSNTIISEYSNLIIGRMGIPYKEKNVSVISLIVDGTTDEIGALSGKLGSLPGIAVKSMLTKK